MHDVTHPAGSAIATAVADRCLLSTKTLVSVLSLNALGNDAPLFTLDASSGPVHEHLTENRAAVTTSAPLFFGQGIDDEVIPISMQRATAERLAGRADMLVYEYPGRTHMGVIDADSPLIDDLYTWADEILLD